MAGAGREEVFGRLDALVDDVSPAEWWFDTPVCEIGRVPGVQVLIPREAVSRRHARIERDGASHFLQDLGSSNGTYINGQRAMHRRLVLVDCDEIGFGTSEPVLRFREVKEWQVPPARPKFDEANNRFTLAGQPLELTSDELALLKVLWQHYESVCDRATCASAIWGPNHPASLERSALVQVVRDLRKKVWRVNPTGEPITLVEGGFKLAG
jgi:hypothetical protein